MAVNYNIPLQTQLEYMMQELQGPEARTMEEFGSGKYISPQDYAAAFDKFYAEALDALAAAGSQLDKHKLESIQSRLELSRDVFFNELQLSGQADKTS